MKAVSVWLKRRIPIREKWPKDTNVILGSYFVGKFGEIHIHFPADVFPVWAGSSKLQRLWAFPAIGLSNPNSENSGAHEGENQIPGATSRIDS